MMLCQCHTALLSMLLHCSCCSCCSCWLTWIMLLMLAHAVHAGSCRSCFSCCSCWLILPRPFMLAHALMPFMLLMLAHATHAAQAVSCCAATYWQHEPWSCCFATVMLLTHHHAAGHCQAHAVWSLSCAMPCRAALSLSYTVALLCCVHHSVLLPWSCCLAIVMLPRSCRAALPLSSRLATATLLATVVQWYHHHAALSLSRGFIPPCCTATVMSLGRCHASVQLLGYFATGSLLCGLSCCCAICHADWRLSYCSTYVRLSCYATLPTSCCIGHVMLSYLFHTTGLLLSSSTTIRPPTTSTLL